MGNDISTEQSDPSIPPRSLASRDIDGVAQFILEGRAKRIVVLTGAGLSTSAGIPDFRSPETGLYANLARLDLPSPEAVFDISYFRSKPEPFYVLAKELYPGHFFPTVAHSFISLLNEKDLLLQLFTQNIDCLERKAGVPSNKLVEAHGSFATQRCIDCKTQFADDLMKESVIAGSVPHCTVPQCNGLVKPDIVFFGEALPSVFHERIHMLAMADLVIILGTSLAVAPFSTLPQLASEGVPRVMFNRDRVGDIGSRLDDVVLLGDCDEGVRRLADALGWRDELEAAWLEVGGKVKETEVERLRNARPTMSEDELLEAEINKITAEVESTLKVTDDHVAWVNKALDGSLSTRFTRNPGTLTNEQDLDDPIRNADPVAEQRLVVSRSDKVSSVTSHATLDSSLPQNRPDDSNGSSSKT